MKRKKNIKKKVSNVKFPSVLSVSNMTPIQDKTPLINGSNPLFITKKKVYNKAYKMIKVT